MKAIAEEVGLDPALIERAARLLPTESRRFGLGRVLGGPITSRLDTHYAQRLTERTAAQLLSLIRASFETQGKGEASNAGLSWASELGGVDQIFVTAHPDGDGTRVLVKVDRHAALVAMTALSGAAAALVLMFAGAVGGEWSPVAGALVAAGGVGGVIGLARAWWSRSARRISQKTSELAEAIGRALGSGEGG